MFIKLNKNKKGQNVAEYALLISLVVAAVIAMQTYAQRAIQGRIRDAGQYLTAETSAMGASAQYEPYYLQTAYEVARNDIENIRLDNGVSGLDAATNRTRTSGGFQSSNYTAPVAP